MTDVPVPLDARKQEVLRAVVAGYTDTGVPVGSQILASRYLDSWSPATIRNDLATLVDVGYLIQPHTSAGRVPSDRGYRYYVNFLMQEEPVPGDVALEIAPMMERTMLSVEEVLEVAAMTLARATESVSLVSAPTGGTVRLKHVDLVALDQFRALVIAVLEGNIVRQHLVVSATELRQDTLSVTATVFNHDLPGKGPAELRALQEGATGLEKLFLEALVAVLDSVALHSDSVVVHDGVRNLLRQPEFDDVSRLQQVLDVLEEESVLRNLLSNLDLQGEIQVIIGEENGLEQLRSCSMVLTRYQAGDGAWGTVAVLGPTRMHYSHIAPRLRLVARRLGQAIERVTG